MKIFETNSTPNGRRVRMFLAEKGIDMEYVQVDIVGGENISPEFLAKNPGGRIPVLELDNGHYISETVSICRYFEELEPGNTPLMGSDPEEKARIDMWQRLVEFNLMMNVGFCFRNVTGYFKDRETPVKEWGEVCGEQAMKFYDVLEHQLGQNEFVAGDHFSIADITAICAIDFARVMKLNPGEQHSNINRWRDAVSSRPSASA
ncbi:glutathione S-transferase family protein [Pseudoteredinibacter isoporae]|uniref:glutathione S-transferase family protein n=1 Tax=Pseudoteredinibacter isoporae TaxID=570281 RepID=UPI00310BBDB1